MYIYGGEIKQELPSDLGALEDSFVHCLDLVSTRLDNNQPSLLFVMIDNVDLLMVSKYIQAIKGTYTMYQRIMIHYYYAIKQSR